VVHPYRARHVTNEVGRTIPIDSCAIFSEPRTHFLASLAQTHESTRVIHERFYCNCAYAATIKPGRGLYGQAGGLAVQSVGILCKQRPQGFQDTGRSPKTLPPHHLGGVRKPDARYSSRRGPRVRAQT